jgi:hypothetical protein
MVVARLLRSGYYPGITAEPVPPQFSSACETHDRAFRTLIPAWIFVVGGKVTADFNHIQRATMMIQSDGLGPLVIEMLLCVIGMACGLVSDAVFFAIGVC